MKIEITEEQTKILTNNIVNEQGLFMDFMNSLNSKNNQEYQDIEKDSTFNKYDNYKFSTTSNDVNSLIKLVIDKLEGGYYHPFMLRDGRVRDRRYNKSGETMFGIDRKNGGDINRTAAGQAFWGLIDRSDARNKWKWNYNGGNLRPQLISLTINMIKPLFEQYKQQYLSPAARKLVDSDKGLTFNFLYATWNGSGWFRKFATKLNFAVANGTTSTNDLNKLALNTRTQSSNSLISQSGNKMKNIIGSIT